MTLSASDIDRALRRFYELDDAKPEALAHVHRAWQQFSKDPARLSVLDEQFDPPMVGLVHTLAWWEERADEGRSDISDLDRLNMWVSTDDQLTIRARRHRPAWLAGTWRSADGDATLELRPDGKLIGDARLGIRDHAGWCAHNENESSLLWVLDSPRGQRVKAFLARRESISLQLTDLTRDADVTVWRR